MPNERVNNYVTSALAILLSLIYSRFDMIGS